MTRWLAGSLGTLLLTLATGCGQQCFLSREVYCQAYADLLPEAETDPKIASKPMTGANPAPPDIHAPDRPPRYMTLEEVLAIALETGRASTRSGIGTGEPDENLVNFQFGTTSLVNQSDRIRVLSLNPAVAQASMEAALARFDAVWVSSMSWTNTDELQQGLQSFQNGQTSTFISGIVKPLATGGFGSVSYQTDYRMLSNPPTGNFTVLNPQYTTRLVLGFEQPLWQSFGVDINQILPRLPNLTGNSLPQQMAQGVNQRQSELFTASFLPSLSNTGILVARLQFDQSRAEFERNVQALVLQAEVAYWKLYQAYGRLYAFEEVLRIAHSAWMTAKANLDVGRSPPEKYYPVRAQYEEFRGERTAALGEVLDRERKLRVILGLPPEDGCRIVPITPPTLAPFMPDWDCALRDAVNLRPELVIARENVRSQQYNMALAKNLLKPDLRFFANYAPVGIGTSLYGNGTFLDGSKTPRNNNALASLASSHFADWTMGLNMNVPIGFRFEHAATRAARLGLMQSLVLLRDQEERAKLSLTNQYQKLAEWHLQIETRRAERQAYREWVRTQLEKVNAGQLSPGDLTVLDAQRRYASALIKEYEAIAEYNNSLVRFEWTKGTILRFNNIHIADGQVPVCAQVRAVEHERDRSRALVLAERPADPMAQPGRHAGGPIPELLPADGATTKGFRAGYPATSTDGGTSAVPLPTLPAPKQLPGDATSRFFSPSVPWQSSAPAGKANTAITLPPLGAAMPPGGAMLPTTPNHRGVEEAPRFRPSNSDMLPPLDIPSSGAAGSTGPSPALPPLPGAGRTGLPGR